MKINRMTLERLIRKGMREVKNSDLGRAVRRARIVRKLIRGPLADIAGDVSTLIDMVKDYVSGEYRDVPQRTVLAAAFAVLYVLDPFDLIPDFIPGIGYIDDTAVVLMVIQSIRHDVDRYRGWTERVARRLRRLSAAAI